jgi:hypothetical protein
MLFIGNKEVDTVAIGRKIVTQICKGAIVVWEAIKSCFGSGGWRNESSWSNTEGWKN